MTHFKGLGHMRDGLDASLLPDRFSQTPGGPSLLPARAIWLSKTFLTGETAEAALVENEFDWVPSQSHITLLSCSPIMDLHARLVASWARRLRGGGYHFDSDRAILLPGLGENPEFWQIQWDNDAFFSENGFCGMLAWQGLFSLISVFLCLPSSTKSKPFLLPFSSVSPQRLESHCLRPNKNQATG